VNRVGVVSDAGDVVLASGSFNMPAACTALGAARKALWVRTQLLRHPASHNSRWDGCATSRLPPTGPHAVDETASRVHI
jgi:hypothetical protein